VARRPREFRDDRLARELRGPDGRAVELAEARLLLGRRGRIDALVRGIAELLRELGIELRRRLPRDREDLGGQKAQQDAVLVRRPDRAVVPQERCARALLAAE